jgi:hypothetical protein
MPASPDRESGEDDSVAERLMDGFDEYVAKTLVDPTWEECIEKAWVTPVCEDEASFAKRLSSVQNQWHELVLGNPVEKLTGLTPLGDIAADVPLPADIAITNMKRLVQFTGIFVGLTTGQPLLVNACLKSLVHDVILKVVSEGVRDYLRNTSRSVGTRERDLDAPNARAELVRQAAELKNYYPETKREREATVRLDEYYPPVTPGRNQDLTSTYVGGPDMLSGQSDPTRKEELSPRGTIHKQADFARPPAISISSIDTPVEDLDKPASTEEPPQGYNNRGPRTR